MQTIGRIRSGVLAAGALALVAGGFAWSAGLLDAGSEQSAPSPSGPLGIAPPPDLDLPPARGAGQVLLAPSAPPVGIAAVRDAVAPLLRDQALGRHVGFAAYDLGHGRPLWSSGLHETFVPASTLKLLTTTAALQVLGGDHRFETTVTRSAGKGGVPNITLVGGGDPLLARRGTAADSGYPAPATLSRLVHRTARALRGSDIISVRLGYDASLFTGPAVSPSWEPDYVPADVVTPISALWVDQGVAAGAVSDREPDPARSAAEEFAAALERRGVRVLGQPAATVVAGTRRRVLAQVTSPPLDQIVQYVLERSDNEGAEVLLRQVALGIGGPGSFDGGVAALQEVLTPLGVPWQSVRVYDGSGLSRADRLTLAAVIGVLRLAVDPEHPELRPVVSDLPVARFTGSLAYRFTDAGTEAARGVARAKTGTLSHVHALAGVTVDRSGAEMAFVAVADRVRLRDTLDARDELDRVVAALSACGCSR